VNIKSSFIVRRPLTAYYVLAFFIVVLVVGYWQLGTWVYEQRFSEPLDVFALVYSTYERLGYRYINLVSTIHIFFYYPLLIPAMCFGLAPTLAAMVVESRLRGWAGLKNLFRRLLPYGAGARRSDVLVCYALIVAATFLLYVVFLFAQSGQADEATIERSRQILGLHSPVAFILAFLIGALMDEGGLLEELGWRGFALPVLIDRLRNPLLASVLIGVLWAGWHLPREIALLFAGDSGFFHFLKKQTDFFASGIAVSIIITWFFLKSGGSVVPAIMIHGLANFFSKTFYHEDLPVVLGALRFQTVVEILLAVLIVFAAGSRLGQSNGGTGRHSAPS
jgi:hypothetical protein